MLGRKEDLWPTLIERCNEEWNLNESFINSLLQNFDHDKQRFNLTKDQKKGSGNIA